VPADSLLEEVRGMAKTIAQGPTQAFRASKSLVHRIEDERLPLEDVLGAEAAAQGAASRTSDYREGFAAFQAKRQPRFVGS
jgi:enoyl-CoA hydratase/carnithine racemase